MLRMTFDEYDELMEKYANMSEHVYWPTKEQITMFENNPDKWLMFCIFLNEKNPSPVTDEEKLSKKMMTKFINNHLELVEDKDE